MVSLLLTLVLLAPAQESPVELSRAEQLRLARHVKSLSLTKPSRTRLEAGLYEFKERQILERFQKGFLGFHPLVGGMHTGSGFATGVSYINGGLTSTALASLNGYQKYELKFEVPQLVTEKLFADVRATYRNFPQEDFFGIGASSSKDARRNYRIEDLTYAANVGVRLNDAVKAGVHVGWIDSSIAAGTDTRVPVIEPAFDGSEPTYVQSGIFLDVDYRDEPGNPRDGGRYTLKWSLFKDQTLGRYDFAQYDVELQQYFPFFNQRRVIALRGKTTLTHSPSGQEIPFFMLPTLGGSEDLRGFQEFRFRDRNMVVMNAEYRWEAFSGLDMAIFADAGHVAKTARDIDLKDFKTAAGLGFRFNTAKSVFWRVDFGFSEEGGRVFMKFGHVF